MPNVPFQSDPQSHNLCIILVIFKDGIRAREILDATDPLKQKKLGRQVKNFDPAGWGRKSVVVVKYGNEHKVRLDLLL
ncbi:MAG: hypothetical protein AB2705_17405 [Candidatus Thiodiazotropha sp.]